MFKIEYKEEPSLKAEMIIGEDDALTLAFAKFVRMCEIVGYQDGSWENLLTEIEKDGFQNLSIWALDTIFEKERA